MKFKIKYSNKFFWLKKGWAMVFWPWMFVRKDKKDFTDRHFRHELQHCYQVQRKGRIMFLLGYLWGLRKGYRNHPYEVEARQYENQPLLPKERSWKDRDEVRL